MLEILRCIGASGPTRINAELLTKEQEEGEVRQLVRPVTNALPAKRPILLGAYPIVFPDNFTPLVNGKHTCLIGCKDATTVELLAAQKGGEFEIIHVDMEGIRYVLALKGFTIFPYPRRSGSLGSRALYLAQSKDPMEGLLVQLLPRYSVTSKHFHDEPVREAYYTLEGRATLATSKGNIFIDRNRSYVVTPYIWHQVQTGSVPALTLLEIAGSPNGLEGLVHHYVE